MKFNFLWGEQKRERKKEKGKKKPKKPPTTFCFHMKLVWMEKYTETEH